MSGEKKFIFSVIIPVYNTEKYVSEALESLIGQTIGFLDNIQVIIINDGSTDGSGKICQKYRDIYPENILYFEQSNKGVSAARNNGMKYVLGKFVNFLDADDKWAKDAFKFVNAAFEENKSVDVVSCRRCYFGRLNGFRHPSEYIFNRDKIVDINNEFNCIQMSVATSFIRKEAIGDNKFDTRLNVSEDALFITNIIFEKQKYYVLRSATYYYRKRDEMDSTMDTMRCNKNWYFDVISYADEAILSASINRFGYITKYAQFVVMYELTGRIPKKMPADISSEECRNYFNKLKSLIMRIDDDVILSQANMELAYRVCCLKIKHGTDSYDVSGIIDRIKAEALILYEKNNILHIEGRSIEQLVGSQYVMCVVDERGKRTELDYYDAPCYDRFSVMGGQALKGRAFKIDLPVAAEKRYMFMLDDGSGDMKKMKIKFGQFSRLQSVKGSYFETSNLIFKRIDNEIRIYKRSVKRSIASRLRYEKYLKQQGKGYLINIRNSARRAKRGKPIWLITDRTNNAGDNGEALFRYLMKTQASQKYDIFFAIDAECSDYLRMKSYGRVLKYLSEEYKIKFLAAEKIISSHWGEWVYNAFGEDKKYISDMIEFDYIFLQHGITKDDLSSWGHITKKNIDFFVTAAKPEWKSIVNGDYGYSEEKIKLTGFPRFDNLVDEKKKKIVFMPTWRNYIKIESTKGSSHREYSNAFKHTYYFDYYNKMINDANIIETMKKYGYTGEFYVHPLFEEQYRDFEGNDIIRVVGGIADYQKAFRENALLVTDYSSVAMDFAYLKKPVVYCQFDIEKFYGTHTYSKGYFDYEEAGFGPVCYDYESAVKTIIKYVENDCLEERKYADRVDDFFAYTDRKNCERVYNAIVSS